MIYVLICLCLSLAGIAGLQFFYMMYLEQTGKGYKKRIRQLEHHCLRLSKRLKIAESKIAQQEKEIADSEASEDDEVWADVIEDF
ncbi:MAG: hypothetical protein DWQ47_14860 [Acidobacteria bacterium]|nr:MAG: hypothetical protein DWQ32_02260 [Acidobacteriota bacterium]REK02654.1 MAG: hypothetical protein DWQ38_09875 [Acidobacteriota bacterium]REK13542.1 MAG: hypothetical protein DWQ43_07950 [Acidobacteriota bacterium]REK41536.1 MAG: hypothetical protein DWQ47_14860 [Acidobacteriota bacterium]